MLSRERTRRWRAANPEGAREIAQRGRAASRERGRRWRAANPERQRDKTARWRAANREWSREIVRRGRRRRISTEMWVEIKNATMKLKHKAHK